MGLERVGNEIEMKIGYPLKHWLSSLTIGPLIAIAYDAILNFKLMTDAVGIYLLFVAYGILFSLPVFLLYVLTYNKIIKTDKSNLAIKIVLNALGITGVIVTFSLIRGSITMMASVSYSVALILTSTFYRIRPKEIRIQTR